MFSLLVNNVLGRGFIPEKIKFLTPIKGLISLIEARYSGRKAIRGTFLTVRRGQGL
jgi:hypothetical protein